MEEKRSAKTKPQFGAKVTPRMQLMKKGCLCGSFYNFAEFHFEREIIRQLRNLMFQAGQFREF